MDIPFPSFHAISMSAIFAFFIFVFFLLWILKSFSINMNNKRVAPKAGGAWPVIGHLHLLRGSKLAHLTLANMAEKYGPIFTIKLGMQEAVVVSDWEVAEECLTTNDKAFASRPKLVAAEVLGFNNSLFGMAPYGPYWRHARKIVIRDLLSFGPLEMLKHVQEAVVKESLQELYLLWSKTKDNTGKALVDMKKWFGDVNLNMMLRIIAGNKISSSDDDADSVRWKKALRDFFELNGKFIIADAFPFLRWLDIGGEEKLMKKTAKELEKIVEEWLQEHKRRKASGEVESDQDFMDVLLSTLSDTEWRDADSINKAISLTMLLGGSDTPAVTLTWALSLLLNNPDVLKKAQQEFDTSIGKDGKIEESNTMDLVYLQAIIKETLRLYPPSPVIAPHESMEDCEVSGYHIPAGTRLFINVYKIQRDSRVWSDPDDFQPERFLSSHKEVSVKGQHFQLIPFSSGRRMCPAASFALQVVQLTLNNLLQQFEFSTPFDEPIDMSEAVGLTNLKATPLEVLISPRLPASSCDLI